ncbi:MAG: ribosomal-processing cysteine protease Prp [Clostridium sp.]|uniref:ribosomal-processing cysteine protease Prp n=1 Tax=Clostridium sp. TaxID=1506 RepID=UPI0039E8DE3B
MINIVFTKKHNCFVSFNINGHACFSEEGYDIVCSAVSALAYTFANGITEIVGANAEISICDGFLSLDLKNEAMSNVEKCQILMKTMLSGMQNMEINYGDYIKVEIEEVQ